MKLCNSLCSATVNAARDPAAKVRAYLKSPIPLDGPKCVMVGAETMAAMRGECFYSDAQQEMLPANVISWGIRGTMAAQDCAILSPPYVHAPPPGFQAVMSRTSGGSVLGHRASPGTSCRSTSKFTNREVRPPWIFVAGC